MRAKPFDTAVDVQTRRRLFIYNGGFLKDRRVRRILSLAGYDVSLGLPKDGNEIGVWGHSPTAHRGEALAKNAKLRSCGSRMRFFALSSPVGAAPRQLVCQLITKACTTTQLNRQSLKNCSRHIR